jgi:hypothetical protein
VQPLPERVATDQFRQLGRSPGMPAEGELGGQPVLKGVQAELLQSLPLGLGEGLVGDVGQGRAAPQPERLPQHLGGRPRLAALQQPVALLGQRHEAGGVEVPGRDHQPVAGRLGDQHPRRRPGRATGFQRPAQVRHIGLQRGAGLGGLLLAPQLLDQPVERDHLVRMNQHHRQHGPLLGPPQLHPALAVHDLQGPEDPKLHRAPPPPDPPSCRTAQGAGRWLIIRARSPTRTCPRHWSLQHPAAGA